jgi:hypothetical protein
LKIQQIGIVFLPVQVNVSKERYDEKKIGEIG